ETLLDRTFPPGEIELALRSLGLHGRGVLDEALRRVLATVEDDVLDALEQLGWNVLVDRELARVDDAHVEPGSDSVVEERCVHGLAPGGVAAEREAEVRDAAGDLGPRAPLLDQARRLDVGAGELRVLLDPGRDGEHVRVEDEVLRRPTVLREQAVGAFANLD